MRPVAISVERRQAGVMSLAQAALRNSGFRWQRDMRRGQCGGAIGYNPVWRRRVLPAEQPDYVGSFKAVVLSHCRSDAIDFAAAQGQG